MGRTLRQKLTGLMVLLSVGLPVTIGMGVIVVATGAAVFSLLLASVFLISGPFLSSPENSVGYLMEGIPQRSAVFFGIGCSALTVVAFMGLIILWKAIFGFLRGMINSMTTGENEI